MAGIFDSPMRRYRMAWPDRACLTRGVVADGEHEIHVRRIWPGELLPAFRAQSFGWIADPLQQPERDRVDRALGEAPSREGAEVAFAQLVERAFREDRARRISGAEEQDIEHAVGGHSGLLQQQGVSSATSGAHSSGFPAQQSLTRNRVSARSVSRSAR